MMKFTFTDGDKIGYYDGKATLLESEFVLRYREYAEARIKNDEWKYTGEGARFRGDFDVYRNRVEKVSAYINSTVSDGEKITYSFTVNGSSGVRKKETNEKAQEEHIYSSQDEEILSLCAYENNYAVTVRRDGITSSIGILNGFSSELQTLTEGDSRDQNASFTSDGQKILFDSAGVGRTSDGEFSGKYAPAVLCELDLNGMEINELYGDSKYSYIKPKQAKDGSIYCIRRPEKEKKGNILLEILLIPVRIFQAIVMFIQSFVVMFTGKTLTSAGGNPAKGRDTKSQKLYIDGNLLDADREYKRNLKMKDKEVGFIPMSWKLVKLNGGEIEVLQSGVCDYDFIEDGFIYTNGKHIFRQINGKREKLVDCEMCLSVSAVK